MYRIDEFFSLIFSYQFLLTLGYFFLLSNHLTKFHYGSLMDDHKFRLRLNHLQMGESIQNRHG